MTQATRAAFAGVLACSLAGGALAAACSPDAANPATPDSTSSSSSGGTSGTSGTSGSSGTDASNPDTSVPPSGPSGTADATFGPDGVLADHTPIGHGVVVQSDGKVVFCAAKGIMRVTPTGALDTSFGNGGVIKPSVAAQCADLVGLADGKLFAIFKPKVDNNPSVNVVFARFTSGGQPDASYGNGGAREVLTPVTGLGALSPIMGRRVVLATDGSFVLADMDVFAGGLARPLSAKRYDSVGDPVASYVTNGPAAFRANHAALLPDGRMVVVGYHDGSNTGSVLRLDANGALDATFGAGGEVVLVDLFARFVLAQPDGKLLIAAEIGGASFSPQGLRVARLLSDGTLDATFGTGGVAQATTGDGSATVVAVDGSGRIVVAGALGTNGPINSAKLGVARFTANGQIDATFGSGGKSQPLDLPMVNEYPVTMSFDGLGRIVLGIRATGVPDHGLIFRLWP